MFLNSEALGKCSARNFFAAKSVGCDIYASKSAAFTVIELMRKLSFGQCCERFNNTASKEETCYMVRNRARGSQNVLYEMSIHRGRYIFTSLHVLQAMNQTYT